MQTDAEALGRFWTDPYGFTPPEGEPVSQFAERVLAAVARLQQRYAGEQVLLISHGGVMKLLQDEAAAGPGTGIAPRATAAGRSGTRCDVRLAGVG